MHVGHVPHARARRAVAAVLVLALAAPPPTSHADADGMAGTASAINVAGRQRMLTQRMVKAYVALGLGVLPARARSELDDAAALFARQLARLEAIESDAELGRALDEVAHGWARFEPLVRSSPSADGAARLDRLGDRLLAACERLVAALESRRGSPVGRLVNISGRQRMLSQRLAKLYLLRVWGVASPDVVRSLAAARAEFESGLAYLHSAPEVSTEILDELAAVQLQWSWFDFALDLADAQAYSLVVLDSSESILNAMETVTTMFERAEAP